MKTKEEIIKEYELWDNAVIEATPKKDEEKCEEGIAEEYHE